MKLLPLTARLSHIAPRHSQPSRQESLSLELQQEVLDQLSALLRAGRHPNQVWVELHQLYQSYPQQTPQDYRQWVAAAAQAAGRGESPIAIIAGRWPWLASCMLLANKHGVALADVVDRYRSHIKAQQELSELVVVESAAARATQRLLLLLPVAALALSQLLGINATAVLFGHWAGWLCLVAGALLSYGAWYTSSRMINSLQESATTATPIRRQR